MKGVIKKIAAVAAGSVMLVASLGSAIASDYTLGDFPEPFIANEAYVNTALVAVSTDAAARTLVKDYLDPLATATTGGSSVTTTGGETKEIPLGWGLNDTSKGFGLYVTDSTVDGFMDSEISVSNGDTEGDYNVHEQVNFSTTKYIGPETGLTYEASEDWKDNIFMPAETDSWSYYYIFDTDLKDGNLFTNTTSTYPMKLDFLGETLRIESATATSITLNVGTTYYMDAGDSITVGGKTITLSKAVSTNKVQVDVDGVSEVITENTNQKVNGIDIRVEDVADDDGIEWDSATLIVSTDNARKTYNDGDEYIGEDEDAPMWKWDLAALGSVQPVIGVTWGLNVDSLDEDDNPAITSVALIGDSYCLPNNYACVTLGDHGQTYQKYELSFTSEDLYMETTATSANYTSQRVVKLKAVGASDDGFKTNSTNIQADTIYLWDSGIGNETTSIYVFYEEQDGTKARFDTNSTGSPVDGYYNISNADLFHIDYKSSEIAFDLKTSGGDAVQSDFNLTLDLSDETYCASDLIFHLENDTTNGGLRYFGETDGDTTTANDLMYGTTDISGWEESTMTECGVKIEDPKSHQSGDQVVFYVPSDIDNFEVPVTLSATVTATSEGSGTEAAILAPSAVTSKEDYNLILFGGPCVNTLTADFLGLTYPSCGSAATGFEVDKAMLELKDNGDNVALIVAGWEADDTKRAATVLANKGTFATDLAGKSSVTVTGGLTVDAITIA